MPIVFSDSASFIVGDLLALIDRELARATDPARREWLTSQRARFADAASSSKIFRDPSSVTRLMADVRSIRAAILDTRPAEPGTRDQGP